MVNCSICLDAFKTPMCCIPCGHVFCNMCVRRWQRQHGTTRDCPQCGCQIEQAQILRFDTTEEVNDIESMKRKSEDWKYVLTISMVGLVVLLLVDVQHKNGHIQSVIFPVFHTFFFIIYELLACLAYIVVRLIQVITVTIWKILLMLIVLIPLFILLYFISPSVQQHSRPWLTLFAVLYLLMRSEIADRRQHQNRNQEQVN